MQEVIERFRCQGTAYALPRSAYGQAVQPFANGLPDHCRSKTVTRQRPGEQHRECPAATPSIAPVRAEYPVSSDDTTLVCRRIVAVHCAMPVETARAFAERAGQRFERAKELLKTLRIRYKHDMSWFSHSRKIDGLDELRNKACDAIRAGSWDQAERFCRKLRDQFPDELDADDRMAQLRVAQQDYAGALPYARTALQRARASPDKFHPDLVADLAEQVDFIEKEKDKQT